MMWRRMDDDDEDEDERTALTWVSKTFLTWTSHWKKRAAESLRQSCTTWGVTFDDDDDDADHGDDGNKYKKRWKYCKKNIIGDRGHTAPKVATLFTLITLRIVYTDYIAHYTA